MLRLSKAHLLALIPHALSAAGGFISAGLTPITVIIGLVLLASALAWTYTEFERQLIAKKIFE